MFRPSKDQKNALDTLMMWFCDKNKSPFITLGGYAGTGKTTLIAEIRKKVYKDNKKINVAFLSYTGKASRVLRSKLVKFEALYDNDFVGTIHSLIYSPIEDDKQEIIGWEKRDAIYYDLLIIDESSMIDANIWDDLLSYEVPIIAVGDHGQLPPINSKFNLMEKPDLVLEHIHRQAKGNPIIALSIEARIKGMIPAGVYGRYTKKFSKEKEGIQDIVDDLLDSYNEDTMILCGYNHTRIKLNQHIRAKRDFQLPYPEAGDRVICLRNNREKEIMNGMIGTIMIIEKHDDDWFYATIQMDGNNTVFEGLILAEQFNRREPLNFTKRRYLTLKGDLFDFGYALTVHKAQGSQAKRVILFEERFSKMDDETWRRWLYTAVTRAEKELYIIG